MTNLPFGVSKRSAIIAGMAAFVSLIVCPAAFAGDNNKKSAPAPAPHAAPAHSAPATGGGAHGPAAPSGGAAHGPTTSGAHTPGGGNAVTTSGASHGVTTSSAHGAGGVTTSGAGHDGATTTTGGAHGATTGGAGGATPGAANHTAAGTAGHSGAGAAGHSAAGTPNHSASFGGRPTPAKSHELHASNGSAVRTRADGSRSDIHDAHRGVDIHHGLNGSRHVSVERADHSRIVAERGGRGYVQHPYSFHGREFGHRTYYEHGRAYDRFYGRYGYRGHYYDVYAPARYYPYGFYGYAYAPWPAPVPYAWAPAPWYGSYGYYYAYYPTYPAPAFWLADFVFAASLAAAYEAGHDAGASGASLAPESIRSPMVARFSRQVLDFLISPAEAAANSSPSMTPETKQQVVDEIKLLVQQEGSASQANAAKQDIDPGADSVMKLLGDNHPHVFVAGADLDLVSGSGDECAVSQGDVLRVASLPAGDADTLPATVLASKGKKECPPNTTVTVGLSDLQDMHNHMRETLDNGLAELQKKQGSGGIPAAPAGAAGPPTDAAFTKDAPPPDADAGTEVAQQSKEADAAEKEAVQSVAAAGDSGGATLAAGPVSISVGQSIDAVTAALGNPARIIDLGAKKIYNYADMKVIFMNGKVSDVQ